MKKASARFVLIAFWAVASLAGAQDQAPATTNPRFSRPQIVTDVNPNPTIVGRFNCSGDGTIYAFIDGYTPNADRPSGTDRMTLLGIHPDGNVTNFDWHTVDGYAQVLWPRSVFVGNGHIEVLVKAKREISGGKRTSAFLVLTFDLDGSRVRTTRLPNGIEPWALGAFKSGNLILLSEDRLNNRTALDIVAPDGSPIRQLNLGREDYLALASTMPTGPGKYEPDFLIASSTFHPFGDNLLLAPTVISGLPIVELSERGVVKAVVPKTPEGTVLDQFIASTPSTVKLRLGAVIPNQHPTVDSEGKQMGIMGFTPSLDITEFSLTDGSIVHQTNFGSSDVQPACETEGSLHLLTSRGSSGFLSVTTEPMR